jgi:hypothetical protein
MEWEALPPEVRRTQRLAVWLLLSPITLAIGYWVTRFAIRDPFGQDFSALLCLWGLLAVVTGSWQLLSKSPRLIPLRQVALAAALVATAGAALLYPYVAIAAYAHATPFARERTFEIFRCHGRCRYSGGYFVHQRADGTTVEGEYAGPPLPYGRCATVQRLSGDYGFSWVRVVERSQAGGQLNWPIRREDCFGTKPVSSLKG